MFAGLMLDWILGWILGWIPRNSASTSCPDSRSHFGIDDDMNGTNVKQSREGRIENGCRGGILSIVGKGSVGPS